jgi:glutathione peroxidase
MFATTSVRGESANALFKALNEAAGEPSWNFNKYLIDRDGQVVERFKSSVQPTGSALEQRVTQLLAR